MRSLDELLEEAKWGRLKDDEVKYVVERIKADAGDNENLYTLIHILGRSGSKQYKKLVEKFLYYPDFPLVSSIALKTLFNYWGFEEEYLDQLKSFVKGVDWDRDQDVQLIAISAAGEYLRNNKNRELHQMIVDVIKEIHPSSDELVNDYNEILRECASEALMRASGKEWNEILDIKD